MHEIKLRRLMMNAQPGGGPGWEDGWEFGSILFSALVAWKLQPAPWAAICRSFGAAGLAAGPIWPSASKA